jgi:Lon protease-like protein
MTPSLEDALDEMPIFPLPRVVFFPDTLLPLHVFEPRYRAMLAHCMETHGAMVVVRIRPDGSRNADGAPAVESIAGAGIVLEHQLLPDGRSNLVLGGRARVRLEELPFVAPFRRARCTIVEPERTPVSAVDRAALVAAATSFVREVRRRDPEFRFAVPDRAEGATLADVCAAHLVIDENSRQAALEELDEAARVRFVTRELALQEEAFRGKTEKRTLH